MDKVGLGERGCSEPLPEGGWCQVQMGTQRNTNLGSAQARLYRESAGREMKGSLRNLPATSPVTYQSRRWPPDSLVPIHMYLLCISKSTQHPGPSPSLPKLPAAQFTGFPPHRVQLWASGQESKLSLSTRDSCLSRQEEGNHERTPRRTEMVMVMPTVPTPLGYRVY